MNNSDATSTDVQTIAFKLRHLVTTEDQARELLGSLPARTLRLVAQAYDPYFPTLRSKASAKELVSYMIRNTVAIRAWVTAWKAEQR